MRLRRRPDSGPHSPAPDARNGSRMAQRSMNCNKLARGATPPMPEAAGCRTPAGARCCRKRQFRTGCRDDGLPHVHSASACRGPLRRPFWLSRHRLAPRLGTAGPPLLRDSAGIAGWSALGLILSEGTGIALQTTLLATPGLPRGTWIPKSGRSATRGSSPAFETRKSCSTESWSSFCWFPVGASGA